MSEGLGYITEQFVLCLSVFSLTEKACQSYGEIQKAHFSCSERKSTPDAGPSPKQPKLWEAKRVSQINVDKGIIDFVIQGLHPLSVVSSRDS